MIERLRIIAQAILKGQGFLSAKQISGKTMIDPKNVQVVLDRLMREGLIKRFDLVPNPGERSPLRGRPKRRVVYLVVEKKRLEKRITPKLTEDAAADRIWSVVRNKTKADGRFTIRDIVALAGVKVDNARWFIKMLHRAGFVTPSKKNGQGVHWRLIKDPGPRRPYIGDVVRRKIRVRTAL
jgi:DNA-binding MarR family transcriptional regulator